MYLTKEQEQSIDKLDVLISSNMPGLNNIVNELLVVSKLSNPRRNNTITSTTFTSFDRKSEKPIYGS